MTEQTEPAPGVWGAPVPERTEPGWSWKKTVAATGVALGVATAGGFAVYAASGATADSPGGRGGGPMLMRGGQGGALHGEFVVPDERGGYKTQLTQTGEVTEVSDTALTAKSDDGYTKTYTIDGDTVRAAVEVGDEVVVTADEVGVAESIAEPSTMAGPGGGPAMNQQGVPPRREGTP
ncbi:hypothetical protein SAMN05192558_101389 [Actinokineospora alba]|uniref:DUF5666 domain-containing protein n=1 Tax=Actinokineospora alba TaxID=504798 RepID=A0A1H0FIY4_9PSEU|nr:hypothetical protein [Actinokineospora alba]TDP69497.1 hypothetical protein C8E96_5085 [Actinokineospora alba]SDI15443.1 hypothetical protein SAMN05421871_103481 [Actinokineospora alba]SDN94564.1 hypothetical protein SAMN05192558_101389 [Actinokineospora alba]